MATDTEATNFAVKNAIASASDFLARSLNGGQIYCQIDYDEVDSIASGSTLMIGKVPKGATIVACIVAHGAGTNAVTGTIGDADSVARWGAVTTMAAAGVQVVTKAPDSETTGSITCGMGYKYTKETNIYLTTGGADFDSDCFLGTALLYTRD